MAYSLESEVRNLAECLEDAEQAKILAGIAWGDSVIDAKLSRRYSTPFGPVVPKIIKSISIDLAGYHAMMAIHTAGGEDVPVLNAQALKDRAYELLQDLQDGDSTAPTPGEGEPPVSTLQPSSIMSNTVKRGILARFDGVNIPRHCYDEPPFAVERGGWF